jgi:hypothetical protein
LTAYYLHESRMNIDFCDFDNLHPLGERATRSPVPRSPRHAALRLAPKEDFTPNAKRRALNCFIRRGWCVSAMDN